MSADGDDKLVVKMILDRSQSEAAAKAEGAGYDKITHKADAAYKAATRAAKKASGDRGKAAADASKAEVDAIGRARDAMGRYTSDGRKGLGSVQGQSASLINTFAGFKLGADGLKMVHEAATAMLGAMQVANAEAKGWVDKLLATKNLIRDIAAMTGSKGGSTDAEVQKHLDVRKASGFDDQAAKAFVEGYAGSGEAKKGVNISEAEYDKAKPAIARFAAANSAGNDAKSAETYGNLAGLLMGFRPDNTAASLVGDVSNFNRVLSFGVGDNPTLVREAAEQAGAVLNEHGTGIIKQASDVAAIIATASMKSPKQAGSMMGQGTRVLRGFNAKHAPMLEAAGITAQDDQVSAYEKLFVKLKEAEDAGTAPDQYLAQQGVEAMEDRQSVATMYQYRKYMKKFVEMGRSAPSDAEAQANVDAKFRGDEALNVNVSQAKLDEAKLHNSMMQQHSVSPLMEAETALTKRGEGTDSASAANQDWWRGKLATGWGLTLPKGMEPEELGRKFRLEEEMFGQFGKKGIKVPGRPNPTSPLGGYSGDYTAWITSGEYKQAYETASTEQSLTRQVMPASPGGATAGDVVKAIDKLTTVVKAQAPPGKPPVATRGRGNSGWIP